MSDPHQGMSSNTNTPDDLDIQLGTVSYPTLVEGINPLRDRGQAAFPYGKPAESGVLIFINEDTMRSLETYAAQDLEHESGGVLLGEVHNSKDGFVVRVSDFIHADMADASRTQLTFTHDAWERVNAEKERRCPDLSVLGWYHTHPGMGIFLSAQDTFIQRNFFCEPWQVALVIDPVRKDRGVFKWERQEVKRAPGFFVIAPRRQKREVRNYVRDLQEQAKMEENRLTQSAGVGSRSLFGRIWHSARIAVIGFLVMLVLVETMMILAILSARKAPAVNAVGVPYRQMARDCQSVERYDQAVLYFELACKSDPKDKATWKEFQDATDKWLAGSLDDLQEKVRASDTIFRMAERLKSEGQYVHSRETYRLLMDNGFDNQAVINGLDEVDAKLNPSKDTIGRSGGKKKSPGLWARFWSWLFGSK